MLPVIAIVGRPNVGKSTLFNVLTKSRAALVADYSGLTRDRQYGEGEYNDCKFIVIDTGGLGNKEQIVDTLMAEQALQAIKEANVVLFVVDAKEGLTAIDEQLAAVLRKYEKPIYLVVNKVDGIDESIVTADFTRLGFAELFSIAAAHNRGIGALISCVLVPFSEVAEENGLEDIAAIKIAFIGRPNVGKSTLVNRILGEPRVVVCDLPGTTRDSIFVPFKRYGENYILIDTAGIRRRGRVSETIEKFSIIKALQSIVESHVVVLAIDGHKGLVDQDLRLLGYVLQAGKGLVIAVNKWDGLTQFDRERVKGELDRRLAFADFADTHFISALHGTGVGDLFPSIHRAYESATRKLSTPQVTRILQQAVAAHEPPMVHGRRIKLRYAHAGGNNPPIIVIHGNQLDALPGSYRKYLANCFRKALDIVGTPIKIEYKVSENPFRDKRNKLTPRQQHSRKRTIRKAN